jgi:3-oxoadipate enol-lactonase
MMHPMRNHLTIGARRIGYLFVKSAAVHRNYPMDRGTVVLLHAFPLNADMWESQAALLPPGWSLVAPDLRGFGESTLGEDATSLDDCAEDVIDLIERLHLDESVIGGLSMGGYVALALYRRAPVCFAGLVLADTRPQADSEEGLAARRRMLELVDRAGAAGVADDMLPRLLGASTREQRPDTIAQVRQMILASDPRAIKAAVSAMMARPDSTGLLKSIACPTLVLVGEQDVLTPVAVARQMQRDIMGSMLEIIPGAGHLSNLEQPQAFGAALARFLRRVR